ncbi:MAG TPA: hypothetical protein VES40_08495 [Ilumatobacteraceae bacterium]|nr:hypothetical protein [Ilumatobacteraceae bacterium]
MRWLRHPVVAIVGVTIAVDVLMIVTGMGPQVILVAALGGLVGVAWWFLSDLADVALGASGATAGPPSAPEPRADRRVMQLRTGLAYGQPDRASLVSLRASLIELVDDQLRTVHQIDLAEDPDGAREVIGDDLYAFVDDPDSAIMLTQPRNVDHILTLIERI